MKRLTEEQKQEIERRTLDVVREQVATSRVPGTGDRLRADLEFDSLDMAELAMELEEEFIVTIPAERLSHKTPDMTVGELITLAQEIVAEQEGDAA